MIYRNIIDELIRWSEKGNRKPLILRGARQVGKTTAVNMFSERFEQYIYLNLESVEDKSLFEKYNDVNDLVKAIFFTKKKKRKSSNTLLFIDEIQECPPAVAMLRYFYEQHSDLFVIAAGSLLESLFDKDISFPVGRVEYRVVRPLSFVEFLSAMNEEEALEEIKNIPLNSYAFDKLLKLFHVYTLIGGMPEAVSVYSKNEDLTELSDIFETLIASYLDDVEKYARNDTMVQVIRHAIRSSFSEAGNRIKFHGFGKSNYGSKEMGEALRTLEKAMILSLIYPVTQTKLPLLPDHKRSPKLQLLDTGLMNYFAQIQTEVLGTNNITDIYRGKVAEHIVGQELLAWKYNVLSQLNFWVREKVQSEAEVDFIYPYHGKLIPLEVKSGATGRLRSLHQYMDMAEHKIAIRYYSGNIQLDEVKTMNDKSYYLLSLPYFLVSQIEKYLDWMANSLPRNMQ